MYAASRIAGVACMVVIYERGSGGLYCTDATTRTTNTNSINPIARLLSPSPPAQTFSTGTRARHVSSVTHAAGLFTRATAGENAAKDEYRIYNYRYSLVFTKIIT